MKPERWAQIKSIFYEAAERPVPERAAFIRSRGGDDEAVAMEVESLLGARTIKPALSLKDFLMTQQRTRFRYMRFLPLAEVILFVRENIPHVDPLGVVVNHGNKPVSVACNVEHAELSNYLR